MKRLFVSLSVLALTVVVLVPTMRKLYFGTELSNPPPAVNPAGGRALARVQVGAQRIALVIGNNDYRYIPPLYNPHNDARLIADTLKRTGFELVGGNALFDLDKTAISQAMKEFGDLLSQSPKAVALFYYAGHGMQVEGDNYLMPIDANPTKIADLRRQTLIAADVLQEMKDAGTGLNIVILDACRNNPLGGRGFRDTSRGLAEIKNVPKGTLIAYATQPGSVAQDGPKDGNSPFAAALGTAIGKPGNDLLRTFNDVGKEVLRATQDAQQPWVSNSPIEGDFCFAGCAKEVKLELPATPDPASVELAYWSSIKDSQDPADFQAYLNKYGPKGQFMDLALNRLKRLRPTQNPPSESNHKPIENAPSKRPLAEVIPPTVPVLAKPDTAPPAQPLEKKPEKVVPKKQKPDSNQPSAKTRPKLEPMVDTAPSKPIKRKEPTIVEAKPAELKPHTPAPERANRHSPPKNDSGWTIIPAGPHDIR